MRRAHEEDATMIERRKNSDWTMASVVNRMPICSKGRKSTQLKGYIVLRHRGIGKSIFLYYIWLSRLQAKQAKQPTILVRHPQKVTVFLQHGVFSVSMADLTSVAELIPDNTWCLIDSNQMLQGVPLSITETPFFILQAARSRIDHIQ
ncbi:hypothetical protein F5146DRAFT_635503 [Armillaria mellea]|nr:hypothetical protein F5146DRAFT_635503 [Armillaria mellea]